MDILQQLLNPQKAVLPSNVRSSQARVTEALGWLSLDSTGLAGCLETLPIWVSEALPTVAGERRPRHTGLSHFCFCHLQTALLIKGQGGRIQSPAVLSFSWFWLGKPYGTGRVVAGVSTRLTVQLVLLFLASVTNWLICQGWKFFMG